MISPAQQRQRVGAGRGAHARPQLLGHARAADDVAPLEHVDAQARPARDRRRRRGRCAPRRRRRRRRCGAQCGPSGGAALARHVVADELRARRISRAPRRRLAVSAARHGPSSSSRRETSKSASLPRTPRLDEVDVDESFAHGRHPPWDSGRICGVRGSGGGPSPWRRGALRSRSPSGGEGGARPRPPRRRAARWRRASPARRRAPPSARRTEQQRAQQVGEHGRGRRGPVGRRSARPRRRRRR